MEGIGVVLVTGHVATSPRRAGFHFLAHALAQAGAECLFLTVGLSPISRLRADYRLDGLDRSTLNRVVQVSRGLSGFVWHTPWHPFHLRSAWLDRVSSALIDRWAMLPLGLAEAIIRKARLIIIESGPPVLLSERMARLAPSARLVYRVSDDTRNIGQHQRVIEAEAKALPLFHLISVPSRFLAERFADHPSVRFQPHGIDLHSFDAPSPDPYQPQRWEKEVVSVGHSFFDRAFPEIAARACPTWRFHYIGRLKPTVRCDNVVWHGERPFSETVPYIQHADIGVAPYVYRVGAETLRESSLKLIQYGHCRLPAVTSDFATRPDRPHLFGYRPGDPGSIRGALLAAGRHDRIAIQPEPVSGWDEVARQLVLAAGLRIASVGPDDPTRDRVA